LEYHARMPADFEIFQRGVVIPGCCSAAKQAVVSDMPR
jgi:hypothetical protein